MVKCKILIIIFFNLIIFNLKKLIENSLIIKNNYNLFNKLIKKNVNYYYI